MLSTLLRSIRSRPRHERRILAITTYLAATAIVIALWSSSFTNSFDQNANEIVNLKGASAETASPTDQSKNLTSPFETLTQSIGELIHGFRSVSEATRELAASIEHAGEAATTTPEALAALDEPPLLPPPVSATTPEKTSNLTKPMKESLSQIASHSFAAEDHVRFLAETITISNEPPRQEKDPGLFASIQAHAHILLQTMTNAYNALRE